MNGIEEVLDIILTYMDGTLNDRDELEMVADVEATVFVLNVQERPFIGDTNSKSAVASNNAIVNVDYGKLNIEKKMIGDLGEAIVLNYEMQRLTTEGCPSLAEKIEHSADQMFKENQKYKIYRVYNLNLHTGKGDLVNYEPPFDDNHYNLEPENWLVRIK